MKLGFVCEHFFGFVLWTQWFCVQMHCAVYALLQFWLWPRKKAHFIFPTAKTSMDSCMDLCWICQTTHWLMIPCSYISQLLVFPLIFSPWETGFPRIHLNLLPRPFIVPLCPWVQSVCFWTLSVQRGNTVFSLIANRFCPQFLSTVTTPQPNDWRDVTWDLIFK